MMRHVLSHPGLLTGYLDGEVLRGLRPGQPDHAHVAG